MKQMRIALMIGPDSRMMFSIHEKLEIVAIMKDCQVPARSLGSHCAEVPIEVRRDDGSFGGAHLSLIEAGADLWDSEDISDTRILDALVSVIWTGIFKGTPCNDSAHAVVGACAIVRLGVVDRLVILHLHICRTPVFIVEPWGGVRSLSDGFRKHVRNSRQRRKNLHCTIRRLMVVVKGEDVFMPIRLPIPEPSHRS